MIQISLPQAGPTSEYEPSFTQGATLSPRFLFVVVPKANSPLGLPAGKTAIASSRSVYEKAPWKVLPSVEGAVESEFVRPLISGETLLPYRILPHQHAVLPCTAQGIIGSSDDVEMYPSLAQWWRRAEEIWTRHRSNERLSLKEQLDYQSKLTKQLPVPTLRVVYKASGML